MRCGREYNNFGLLDCLLITRVILKYIKNCVKWLTVAYVCKKLTCPKLRLILL